MKDEPIGYVLLSKTSFHVVPAGYVESIFVKEEFRGTGVSKMLLEFTENHFRSEGVQVVQLDVSKGNKAAVSSYEGQGCTVTRYRTEKHLAL